jgi:hypothetical protein
MICQFSKHKSLKNDIGGGDKPPLSDIYGFFQTVQFVQ